MYLAKCRLLMFILFVVVLMFHYGRGSHLLETTTSKFVKPTTANESRDNSSALTTGLHTKNVILGSSFIISAVEDMMIVLIIYMTKTIDRNTSTFLIAQCVADFVITMWGAQAFFEVICGFDRLSFCFLAMLRSLSIHLLTLSIFNIYIAVCNATLYKSGHPWTYTILMAVLILVSESALQVLFMYADRTFYVNIETALAPAPNYTPENCWIGVLVLLNFVFVPMTVTIICQVKIHQFIKGCSANTKRHIKLSYLIASTTTVTIGTFLLPHILRAFRIYNFFLTASILVHMIFNLLKVPYYLVVYKPFRDTVKRCILCKRRSATTCPHP